MPDLATAFAPRDEPEALAVIIAVLLSLLVALGVYEVRQYTRRHPIEARTQIRPGGRVRWL